MARLRGILRVEAGVGNRSRAVDGSASLNSTPARVTRSLRLTSLAAVESRIHITIRRARRFLARLIRAGPMMTAVSTFAGRRFGMLVTSEADVW